MGSSVSIYNDTDVILNIALSQVGPLYYKNFVQPGECVTFDVGKVWFTIDGRVWNVDNDYNMNKVARPIMEFTLEAMTLSMIVYGRFVWRQNAIMSKGAGDKLTQAMSEVKSACESDITKKLLSRIFNGNAIHSPGWYFGSDRSISISGGPKYDSVSDEKIVTFREIDVKTLNIPFIIKEK